MLLLPLMICSLQPLVKRRDLHCIENVVKHFTTIFIAFSKENKWIMKRVNFKSGHFARILAAVLIVGLWWYFSSSELSYSKPSIDPQPQPLSEPKKNAAATELGTIMPSMPEKDAKEKLGRASWTYFHTLLARFPDEPTAEQSEKLKQFIHLYAELYPCGECSYHFVKTLKKYPPQVSSRTAAAMWGCSIHNLVNEHLGKDKYDCSTILEDYDCGCGDEEGKIKEDLKLDKFSVVTEGKQGG